MSVFCFLASYLVAFALEWTRLLGRSSVRRAVMLLFGSAGLVAHTWYLIARSQQTNLPPLLSSTHDWMLVLAWLVILFYLVITLSDRQLAIGVFLLPLVLVLIGSAYFVSEQPNARVAGDAAAGTAARHGWEMLHATLLVVGILGVVLGFVLSLMYLVQHRRLKHRQMAHTGMELPNLERLARLNWWCVILSVPLLTLGMATGVGLGIASQRGPDPIRFSDPVIVGNLVVWLVMVAFFGWMLRTSRPMGKQVAWMTLWAFGFLLVTLIGLQVITSASSAIDSWHSWRSLGAPVGLVAAI